MLRVPPFFCVVLLLLGLLLFGACGDSGNRVTGIRTSERVAVPAVPWARLTRAQVEEAARMGVPPAFENARGMRFVYVPRGSFPMGSPPEEAGRHADENKHTVKVSVGFFLQVEPVSVSQAGTVSQRGRRDAPLLGGRTHEGAVAFARHLSIEDDLWDYRLPTEAEWEYACRAGATTAYPWGQSPSPPEAFENAWGLRGMHVGREWCADRYAPLPTWTVGDPLGPQAGSTYVVRGGGTTSRPARCARRAAAAPDTSAPDLGFRLVVPLGYGLGRYGSVAVTFRLVDGEAPKGAAPVAGGHDLRIIRMNDRLAARTSGQETVWQRVSDPGSPVTLTMVPGKYYVYAETQRAGTLARGIEIKFHVWDRPVEIPVPIPERDLDRYGSGGAQKPQ